MDALVMKEEKVAYTQPHRSQGTMTSWTRFALEGGQKNANWQTWQRPTGVR